MLQLSLFCATVAATIAAMVWGWVNGALVGDSEGYLGYAMGVLVFISGCLLVATI